MYLRAKFEDGREKRIEWDELGSGTGNPYSVLWSYPVKTDAPIGPVPEASAGSSFGGDQLLVEDNDAAQNDAFRGRTGSHDTVQYDWTRTGNRESSYVPNAASP
jgi:hypothetical protein